MISLQLDLLSDAKWIKSLLEKKKVLIKQSVNLFFLHITLKFNFIYNCYLALIIELFSLKQTVPVAGAR